MNKKTRKSQTMAQRTSDIERDMREENQKKRKKEKERKREKQRKREKVKRLQALEKDLEKKRDEIMRKIVH